MRKSDGRLGKLILLLGSVWFLVNGMLQPASAESTPAATPETAVYPEFFIAALGDHPNGYFEDVVIDPGSSLDLSVVIHNSGSIPVDLRTYKVNALSMVNGGYASGGEQDEPFEFTTWIDYPSYNLSLSPGSSEERTFRVSVPQDASPGQYVAGLVVQTADTVAIPDNEVLDQIIGYAISLSVVVPGEVNASFEIGAPEVKASQNSRMLNVPITNTGNYLVRPAGELLLRNDSGEVVHRSPVKMGSVYSGLSTVISVMLPQQLPPATYSLDLSLVDEDSGATTSVRDFEMEVPEPVDPAGISILEAAVERNAEEIVFANIDVTLNNGGQQIPATNVTLEVMRNGEPVDSFPLANNQVLLSGENQFVTRYLPADMWQSGEYTFGIKVSAVDPNGGQETILLDEELDATIVVP